MCNSNHARRKLFLLRVSSFICREYLKEVLIFIHTIICKMSPQTFALVVILILAIIVNVRKD